MTENDGSVFARLPATAGERTVEGRATRAAVLDFWRDRYGVPRDTFTDHTFWEKGAGKVWACAGDPPGPVAVESLGLPVLRTRQEHWKPTTDAAQRFGADATRNVVHLPEPAARRFLRGADQELDWDGDWGYLFASHDVAGDAAVVGVGLYVHGELRSMVPKGRQRDL